MSPQAGAPPEGGDWLAQEVESLREALPAYEILAPIGRGGMGAVYKARQKSLKRLVAIKVLPRHPAADEFRFAERFRKEAETLAQLRHPGIVQVHDFGETADGLLYFVMEFVDGTDVERLLHGGGRLAPRRALEIAAAVCDALDFAHQRGVVHRDIKPANVLLDGDGRARVADFGLAKMQTAAAGTLLTVTNVAMGTPSYSAPEMHLPGGVVDHRADIFGVGVMLYQMLTGEIPRGMFKLPSQKGVADPGFDPIVVRALESDLADRYQTAAEMRDALLALETAPSAGQSRLETTAMAPMAPRQGSPRRRAALFTVVAVALGAGIALVARHNPAAKEKATLPENTRRQPVADSSREDERARFHAQVAAAPDKERVRLVKEKIEALNGVQLKIQEQFGDGKLIGMEIELIGKGPVPEIWPLGAMRDLQRLGISSLAPRDLSWMRGMKLVTLAAANGSYTDLAPLKDMPLEAADLSHGPARDYTLLPRKTIRSLYFDGSPLKDLSFARGMLLERLRITGSGVTDLSPLRGMPLVELRADIDLERDAEVLLSLPKLDDFNGEPAAEILAKAKAIVSAREAERAAFAAKVAAMPPEQQVQAVKEKIEEINKAVVNLTAGYKDSQVTSLVVHGDEGAVVPELWPIGALRQLLRLQIYSKGTREISWLKGMKVDVLAIASGTFIDLGALRDVPVQHLDLSKGPARDYSALEGKPLRTLQVSDSPVNDISFAKGMPLTKLRIENTAITDLSVLRGLPLVELFADVIPARDRDVLRSIPTLQRINDIPVAEFWARAGIDAAWTDWLGPKAAAGNFRGNYWIEEEGGVSTMQDLKGAEVLPRETRDGAVRVSFAMRGSKGVMISIRETKEGSGRHQYEAQFNGENLHIAHFPPNGEAPIRLAYQPVPKKIREMPEHTLEFRFIGDEFTAVLNNTLRVSARHSALTKGLCAIVLTKGVLVKRVEVQALDARR